ncbi:MAG: FAD-dependent oxidoreductase, partial [Desulfobacterales bacterium]|nr:FAD-dependent oxidoreductase [Desulfobacterales bacterium]
MALKKRSELAAPYDFRTWRDFTPMSVSVSTMLHNRTGGWRFIRPIYEDKTPACQNACPAGCDIEGWVRLIEKKEYENAVRYLKREEPFPAVLGRVCFRFCEGACNRDPLDAHLNINALERFLGDLFPPDKTLPDLPEPNGARLAVVGSGPAGMSAAWFSRLLGFEVVMYEALPEMGGMLRVGIPSFRLPREVVEAEFRGLSNMGVRLRAGVAVGKDVSLDRLREEFDYIFLATGGHSSLALGLAGEKESPGVMSGLAMLKKTALGEKPDLGRRVVVVGGGNTAVDAARTAVRLGSETTILYRRSRDEMPAHPSEIAEAAAEGVHLRLLAAPERIELDAAGNVKTLICCEMTPGAPDESGRRRPEKKEGALFEMEADAVLTAIGEAPDLDYLEGAVKIERGMARVDDGLKALDEKEG